MQYVTEATWWQKEIKKGATAFIDCVIYLLMIITLFSIILFAYTTTYIPEGGLLGPLEITKENAKHVLFVSNIVNGGIGIAALVWVWKLRKPNFLSYQQSALKIVETLKKKQSIDDAKERKMLDTISRNLTPCTDPARRKECEEGLIRVSVDLAKISEQ